MTLTCLGTGNLSVIDDALPANKYSSFNFIDGADEQVEYEYNGVGALTKDLNRGITITYDNLNNPRRIDFNDGNSITYTYLPDGTLIGKKYGEKHMSRNSCANTPVSDSLVTAPGQIIPADSMAMVAPGFIVYGNTEYSGNIIYRDGRPDKVLFPGGYCTLNKETNEPTFHYFTQDHLGNNRVVTNEDGTVEQITHYYPSGGTFNDAGLNAGLQQYKYNGKELDRIAGLNTYDYGARQYFPSLPVWDRIDALCEKSYNMSPYGYCGNNPISRVDKDGNDWYYTSSGLFLGIDNKKTDNIIIREYNIKSLGNPPWQNNSAKYIDTCLKDKELSASVYSNIFTDILIRNGYDMLKTGSGKIEVAKTDFVNFGEMTNRASTEANSYAVTTKAGNEKFNITAFINTSYGGTQNIFSTVSNVVNVLGIHEFKGHGLYKIGNDKKDHIRIYEMQKDDSTWKKTTRELKEHVNDILNELR